MANIIDANVTSVRYKTQSAVGTYPSGEKFQELRVTGEGLNSNRTFIVSQELRADRMTADTVAVSEENRGPLNIEWSTETFDDLIEGALQSTWTTVSFTGALSVSGKTFSGTGLPELTAGTWVKITGFSESDDDGLYRVSTSTTSELVTNARVIDKKEDTTSWSITDSFTGSISGKTIKNGITKKYFTTIVDYQKPDASHIQKVWYDTEISTMSFDASVGSILTGAFELLARSNTEETSAYDDGSPTTSNDNNVLNSVDNIGSVRIDGTKYDDGLQSFSLSLNNNLRPQTQIGSFDLAGIGSGTLALNGSFTAYFGGSAQSQALYDAYKASSAISLEMIFVDADGNTMVFHLPRVKLTNVNRVAGSINTDVVLEGNWEATRDATLDSMIQIYTSTV